MSNIKTQKAILASVSHAGLKFEALMLPDGSYRIGVSQIAQLNLVRPNQASRTIKRLLGSDFQFDQVKSELNPKAINTLTLEEFGKVVKLLAKQGNEIAWALLEASLLEKLERILDSTFGVIVEERERELRFAARLSSKITFHPLTDCLKARGFDQESPYKLERYSTYIWELQTALGIESGTRDDINAVELMRLVTVQSKLTGMMEAGVEPWEALSSVIQSIKEGLI